MPRTSVPQRATFPPACDFDKRVRQTTLVVKPHDSRRTPSRGARFQSENFRKCLALSRSQPGSRRRGGLASPAGRLSVRWKIAGVGPTRATVFRAKDEGQRCITVLFAPFHYGTVFARLDRWTDKQCHSSTRTNSCGDDRPRSTIRTLRGWREVGSSRRPTRSPSDPSGSSCRVIHTTVG